MSRSAKRDDSSVLLEDVASGAARAALSAGRRRDAE